MIIPKNVLVDNITNDIIDNSIGEISPQDIRRNLLDLIDSVSLLTEFNDLNSLNFSTVDPRTTRVGIDTLSKRKANGYSSVDNTAVGYASLKSQIDGSQNTAIGSFALTCNMYGGDNVGVGYHSLGSVINGYANIGVGSFSLNNNKEGNFNIAIGHGAGYYVERDHDYQFFLGSHPIDSDYICSDKTGFGLVPLLKGDMSPDNLRLGIGVRDLHSGAALQVAGNIHPSVTNTYSLGVDSYRFKHLYLQSAIRFNNNDFISYDESNSKFRISNDTTINGSVIIDNHLTVSNNITSSNGHIEVASYVSATSGIFSKGISYNGHITPEENLSYDFGNLRKQIRNAHIYNIYSNGVARFNKFHAEEQTHFRNKTIYLASAGDLITIDGGGPKGIYQYFDPNQTDVDPSLHVQYLIDEELEGAGFKLGASGIDYVRTYELTFKSRESELSNLSIDDVYSRSSWFSNISISLENGRHIKADRIIHPNKVGMFTYSDDLGFFIESGVAYLAEETNHKERAGLGDVNFIANSGETDEYSLSVQSPQSGVNLFCNFFDYTSNLSFDSDNKTKVTGFKTGYISDSELALPNFFNEESVQRPNRYVISSYNDSSYAKRCFTLLQDSSEGYVGISNFDYSESMLPDTMLNVRSTGNAICRLTAENNLETEASLELLAVDNCHNYGASFQYTKHSGVLNVNVFNNSEQNTAISIHGRDGHVGILNKTLSSNAMLSLGSEEHTEAHISMRQSSGVPIPSSGYGQIFTREVTGLDIQSTLLSFMDSSGNLFNVDLTASSADGNIIDKPLGLDTLGNTFGGIRSPESRLNITSTTTRNTAIGYESLSRINDGHSNTSLGYRAGKFVSDGYNNIYIGSNSGSENTTESIVIGTDMSAQSNELKIGHNNNPLISGYFGSQNRRVNIDNKLTISNILLLSASNLSFGSNGFSIGLEPSSPNVTFGQFATSFAKPIQIQASIIFSDGKSVEDGSFLDDITSNTNELNITNNRISQNETSFNDLKQSFDLLVVEGIVLDDVRPGQLPNSFNDDPLRIQIRKKIVNTTNDRLQDAPSSFQDPNIIVVTLRDPYLSIRQGDYVIAMKVNGEYRPISVTGSP